MTRSKARRYFVAVFATALVPAIASCEKEGWGPDELAQGKSSGQFTALKHGQERYSMYCAGCHGEKGDGEGPAARFLDPKPRDFRKGRVKFAAVPAGTLPRDEDLIDTMNRGLHGTSMPSWALLPDEDKRAIVAFIKTLSDVWHKEAPGTPVAIKPDPWRKKPEKGIAEGERVYHGLAACSSCHPTYVTKAKLVEHMKSFDVPFSGFRDRMYESVEKDSDWGAPIKPPDFLSDLTKRARTRDELARVIAAGVGGTAMPSWGETLTDKQLWGLAYYVASLIEKRGTAEAAELRKELAEQPDFKPPPPPEPPPAPPPEAPASASASASANPAAPPKGK